jgi:uncharacterized membrane protein (DUF485 family)
MAEITHQPVPAAVSEREGVQQRQSMATPEWERLAAIPEFKELTKTKKNAIIPATIFFVAYYFALPISVGFFPDIMNSAVIGHITIGYLFALSQFFVAWAIAGWYTNLANRVFDRLAASVRSSARGGTR